MNYQVLFDFPANTLVILEQVAFLYEIVVRPSKEKMNFVMAGTKVMVKDGRFNEAVRRVLREFKDDDYLRIISLKEMLEHVKLVPEKRIIEG